MSATFNPFKCLEMSTNFESFYYIPNRSIKKFSFKINNVKEGRSDSFLIAALVVDFLMF